jgi:hypothetical protein
MDAAAAGKPNPHWHSMPAPRALPFNRQPLDINVAMVMMSFLPLC